MARHQEEYICAVFAFVSVILGYFPKLWHQFDGSLLVHSAEIPCGYGIAHKYDQGSCPQNTWRGLVAPSGQGVRGHIQAERQERGHKAELLVLHATQDGQGQEDGNQKLLADRELLRLPHCFHDAVDERQCVDSKDCGQSHGEVPVPGMRAIEAANVVEDVVLKELVGSDH